MMMDGSMFIGTWWALLPPLLAIVLAFVTKEVYSSLFLGVAVGALLYSGFHPWESFVNFFEIMKDSMNLNILIFDVLLGMIIVLMAKTGGSAAYGKWAGTKIKSKKSALLATTGLGILIFVDDYFNCLTVGSVMRPVTDRYKVSRAKLAYIIDSTAAPVCIIAPISSWAAAVNSYVPEDAGITGFQLFLRTIPYNLYAILTLFMVVFVTVTAFDFGLMKKHEDNAAKGDLFTSGAEEFEQISEDEVNPNGKVIDLVLPVAVLIVSAIGAMIYTGYLGGATDVITAFSGCDAETSLIFATMITIFFMLILYLPRKVVTWSGGLCGPYRRRQCICQHIYPCCDVCGCSIPFVFNRNVVGDICDPCAYRDGYVLRRCGSGDDGDLCIVSPCRGCVRGPYIADLRYYGHVLGGSPE